MASTQASSTYDVAIVGGGIVGLATALAFLEKKPNLKLVLLEKEAGLATHQTGHNSGVIHSGLYYKPGSLKARLCVDGVKRLKAFCQQYDVPYDDCGKVVVASYETEVERLENIFERGVANGVPGLEMIDVHRLKDIEPYASGVAAIYSPGTGIVNYKVVADKIGDILRDKGATIMTLAQIQSIEDKAGVLALSDGTRTIHTAYMVNCGGLYSDKLAQLAGVTTDIRIVPFRGEYYFLKPEKQHYVKGLIYPVPDPNLPFLGVHFTKTIEGGVEAGPNAVLAFAKEGYRFFDINARELWGTLSYPGFWKLAASFWKIGMYEYYRSFSQRAFVNALRKLVPVLGYNDIIRTEAGVRAQAITPIGKLADDFVVEKTANSFHVLNAPSPAATASLAIGEHIVGMTDIA
ncbi:MAG: L-2-hydroxyglutarate oxidase [Deinococcota bacterium]